MEPMGFIIFSIIILAGIVSIDSEKEQISKNS
jgi:hypothetical protein